MKLPLAHKLALLLAGVMVLSALLIGTSTINMVGSSMRGAAEDSVDNVLGLVTQTIGDEYGGLMAFRAHTLEQRREQMTNVSAAVVRALDELRAQVDAGTLTEEQAQLAALDYLQGVRYGNDDYFFTYDRDMHAIAHPDPRVMGRDMLGAKDAKGKPIGRIVRDLALSEGDGFVTFWWQRLEGAEASPKISYVFHYEPWDWIIGTGVYVDDVDRETESRLAEIKAALDTSVSQVTIANSGFVFVVVGSEGEVVMAPQGNDLGLKEGETDAEGLVSSLLDWSAAASGDEAPTEALVKELGDEQWSFRLSRFEPLDWYIVAAVPQSELNAPGHRLVSRQLLIAAAVLLASLVVGSAMLRRITGPLGTLTDYARELPEHDFSLSDSEVAAVEDISEHCSDEVGTLAGSFLSMEQALHHYIDELTESTARQERLESELRIARDIQMGILPQRMPATADLATIDIAASLDPARLVGGDLYDFLMIDDHTLCFVIGDVSGKGVPAALFMAVTTTLVRAVAQRGLAPGEVLTQVNADLSRENESCMFVTLFVGMLDVRSGELRYANAGHNPPLHCPSAGKSQFIPSSGELVAGPVQGIEYSTQWRTMEPGDTILLYTDGVTEAENEAADFFTTARLQDVVDDAASASAQDLVDEVRSAVTDFVGEARQVDDITVMAIRYIGASGRTGVSAAEADSSKTAGPAAVDRPSSGQEPRDCQSITVPATLDLLPHVQRLCGASAAEWHLPPATVDRLNLVLEEVLINVMRYAYPDEPGAVEVQCELREGDEVSVEGALAEGAVGGAEGGPGGGGEGESGGEITVGGRDDAPGGTHLRVRVRDWGVPFDPTTYEAPPEPTNVAERPVGGVGLTLVRAMVEDLRYERKGDTNVLRFRLPLQR